MNSTINTVMTMTETNSSHLLVDRDVGPESSETSHEAINNSALMVFQFIFFTILCQTVDLFGMGTNIINMICFIKQGFKDSVNISLFGLAVADFLCVASLLWTNICFTPGFSTLHLPFEPLEFQHLTACVLHTTFTRLSGGITALITLERCLCITAPLKVQNIVTPKRVAIVVVCLFIVLTSSIAPVYVCSKLSMKYFPALNRTVVGIVYTGDRESVEKISYAINNVFIPFGSFLIIIICTSILVIKLHKNAKWRKTSVTTAQAEKISGKNQKVAKMIIMISILFVTCFMPLSITFIAMSLEPELSMAGKLRNQLLIAVGIGFLLESINSSVNTVFYYNMSSKYRAAFHWLFKIAHDDKLDRFTTSSTDDGL